MTTIMNETKANQEMSWVLRILSSVNSKSQLETALKCFLLWDLKHSQSSNKSELKGKFWALYRNKESQFFCC